MKYAGAICRCLAVLWVLLVGMPSRAQNLIPNSGFEDMEQPCVAYPSYDNLTSWTIALCATGAQYLNICGTENGFPSGGTPSNFAGYQVPADGVGYVTTTTFSLNAGFQYQQYLAAPLTEALEPGVEYCFSIHISLADQSAYRTTDLHVICTSYFPTTCNGNDTANWTTESQLILNTTEVDTAEWSVLSGSFIAAGGEEYITIGDFTAPGTPDTIYVGTTSFPSPLAIYYVDDLELRTCESAVAENTKGDLLVAYDAHAGLLNITAPREDQLERITLVDMAGRAVVQVPRSSSPARLNVSGLPFGVYVVQAAVKGTLLSRRVVIH